ncbi:MAG: class I SAM-dependent methyltransferase [Myxococcota bacterium]
MTRNKKTGVSLARQADRYALYQESVQEPEHEVRFFQRAFKDAYARPPLVLREDFCGTAAICAEWVRSHAQHQALGVDLDDEPLRWGEANNQKDLTPQQRARIRLVRDDARSVSPVKADVVAAQNFSFYLFKTRDSLRDYFRAAHQNLKDEGVLVLDMMGGADFQDEDSAQARKQRGFTYVWEQKRFDPITNDVLFYIHFRFPDGSELPRAFEYDWRLWSIPEVRELMAEAGFTRSEVYWGETDKQTGKSNGLYKRRQHAPADPAWLAYIVGVK